MTRGDTSERPRRRPKSTADYTKILQDSLEIDVRLERAREAMAEQRWDEARELLESLLERAPLPVVRNNLASVYLLHDHSPESAYAMIAPTFESGETDPQPYAHALAVRCLVAMGQDERARAHMSLAIRDLEAGLAGGFLGPSAETAWREYTVALLLAVGALEDDALAWDLYQRWQTTHNHPQAHYLGGVAAFNRRRWTAAQRAWTRIAGTSWNSLLSFIALLPSLDAGVVPAYRLPYESPDVSGLVTPGSGEGLKRLASLMDSPDEQLGEEDLRFAEETVRNVHHWTLLLAWSLTDVVENIPRDLRGTLLRGLVRFGGSRGQELAAALFQAGSVPTELKLSAAHGLVEAGAIANGTEVSMLIEGRSQTMRVFLSKLVMGDADLEERYEAAVTARDEGRRGEAHRLLAAMADIEGTVYLPAMVAYANLLREDGVFGKARQLLEIASIANGPNPTILFNQADLALQVRDFEAARRFCGHLEELRDLSPEFRQMSMELRRQIAEQEDFAALFTDLLAGVKSGFEERSVHMDADLASSLRLLPVRWLNAACAFHGLTRTSPHRGEREAGLLAHLRQDPGGALDRAVQADPRGNLLALLHYLVQRGAWAPKVDVTQRFGNDGMDGIVLTDNRATTTLGHARLSCVVFVGTATLPGGAEPIVGIPLEMRASCARLAAAFGNGSGRPG